MYENYLRVCQKAVKDENVFKTFRRNPNYTPILEHVSQGQGEEYLKECNPILIKQFLTKFSTSEQFGGPLVYSYCHIAHYNYSHTIPLLLSPTTCRYIKVLSDLIKYFLPLEINIVEIGCGYGGQCKIIHDLFKPTSYTLIDIPDVLELTAKWLANFKITPTLRSLTDPSQIKYDLCISNYAFTEFTRHYQDFYAENILKNSTMGYITCNFLNRTDGFSVQEILDLMGGKMYEEKPKTGNNNAIYIWDHR
jgi:hypothetical protein